MPRVSQYSQIVIQRYAVFGFKLFACLNECLSNGPFARPAIHELQLGIRAMLLKHIEKRVLIDALAANNGNAIMRQCNAILLLNVPFY
ncbi:hypothetical protein D3C84_947670 [compost metagenome]